MAVDEGGSGEGEATSLLSARKNQSGKVEVIYKHNIKMGLLARGYIWITKLLSNLPRLKK